MALLSAGKDNMLYWGLWDIANWVTGLGVNAAAGRAVTDEHRAIPLIPLVFWIGRDSMVRILARKTEGKQSEGQEKCFKS